MFISLGTLICLVSALHIPIIIVRMFCAQSHPSSFLVHTNAIILYVTGFAKKGLIHASNFANLRCKDNTLKFAFMKA